MGPNKLPKWEQRTGEHKMTTQNSRQTTPRQERSKSKAKVCGSPSLYKGDMKWNNVTSCETEMMIEERDKATAAAAVAGTQI